MATWSLKISTKTQEEQQESVASETTSHFPFLAQYDRNSTPGNMDNAEPLLSPKLQVKGHGTSCKEQATSFCHLPHPKLHRTNLSKRFHRFSPILTHIWKTFMSGGEERIPGPWLPSPQFFRRVVTMVGEVGRQDQRLPYTASLHF